MNSRLSDQLREQFEALIRDLRTDVDELRNRQRTSGSSGVLAYTVLTGNTYDRQETVTDSLVTLRLKYTGNGSQDTPVVNPYMDLFVGGEGEAWRIDAANQQHSSGSNTVFLNSRFLIEDNGFLTSRLVSAWTVAFQVVGTMTYYAKGYAVGSSPGSVVVERIS